MSVQGIKATSGVQLPQTITTDKNPVNQPVVNPPITVSPIEILSGGVAKNLELLCKTTWLQYDSLITVPLQGTSGTVLLNVPMFGEYLSKPAKLYLLMGDRFMGSVMYRITLFGASTVIGGLEIGTTVHYFATPTINDLRVIEGKTIAANGTNVYTFTLGPIVPNSGIKQHFFTTHDRAVLDSFPDVSSLDWSDFPHFVLMQNIPLQANISSEISTVYMRVETMLSPDFAVINTNIKRIANIYDALINASSIKGPAYTSVDGINGMNLGKLFGTDVLYISRDGYFDIGDVDSINTFDIPYHKAALHAIQRINDHVFEGTPFWTNPGDNGTFLCCTTDNTDMHTLFACCTNYVRIDNSQSVDHTICGYLTFGSTSPQVTLPFNAKSTEYIRQHTTLDMTPANLFDYIYRAIRIAIDSLPESDLIISTISAISGPTPEDALSIWTTRTSTSYAQINDWEKVTSTFLYGENGFRVSNGKESTIYIPYYVRNTNHSTERSGNTLSLAKETAFIYMRLASSAMPSLDDLNFTYGAYLSAPKITLFKKVPEGSNRIVFTNQIPGSVAPALAADGIPTVSSLRPLSFPPLTAEECFLFDVVTPQNSQTILRICYSGYYNAFYAIFSDNQLYSTLNTREASSMIIRNFVRSPIGSIPPRSISSGFLNRVVTQATHGINRTLSGPYLELIPVFNQ